MRSETRITAEERVRDDYPRVTAQCLVSLCRRVVGHAEDGFCMKWRPHRPAHSSTREQAAEAVRGGRPAWLPRPPGRDPHDNHPRLPARRGTGGNGSARGSKVLFFLGRVCWSLLPVLLGLAATSVCWRIERERGKRQRGGAQQPRHSQATGGSHPRTAQERRRGSAQKLLWPPGRAGTSRRPRRWRRKRPTKLRGRRYVAHGTSHQDPAKRAAGETDGNHGESTGTYSNRTLGGTDFRVEPPEHTSCSLLRSRRCSDPNPAPVGDTDWLWFQVIGQKRDSRQVRRKRLGSNSASSPPQIPVPRGKPCRQESH